MTPKLKSTTTISKRWKSAIPGIATPAAAACASWSLDPLEFESDDEDDDEEAEDEEGGAAKDGDEEELDDDEDDDDDDESGGGDWDE